MTKRSKYLTAIVDAITRRGPLTNTQLADLLGITRRDLSRLLSVFEQGHILTRGPLMPNPFPSGPRQVPSWDLFIGPRLPRTNHTSWTEQETAYIRQYYSTNGAKSVGRALGKSAAAVQSKAEREGLKCTKARRSRAAKKASNAAHAAAEAAFLSPVVQILPAPDRCQMIAQTLLRLPALDAAWGRLQEVGKFA